jgi:hypothetical protein
MTTLLNIDANAKTVKGQKLGFLTAILYLAPYLSSGRNVCPMADIAQCHEGCLNTAGRGGIAKRGALIATDGGMLPDNTIQRARLARTAMYWDDRTGFIHQLAREIAAFIKKAERLNLTPVVRLNGTSDIQWERGHEVLWNDWIHDSMMDAFPDVQFYDYTKLPARFARKLPANYHLTLSNSEANRGYARKVQNAHRKHNASVVSVASKDVYAAMLEMGGVDGDANDLRFLDPAGSMVWLKAKGKARADTTGFVIR